MTKKSRLKKLKKVIGSMGIAAVMSIGFANDVFAQDQDKVTNHHDVKVNIKSGGLQLETSDVIPFEDVVIDKEIKTYSTSFENNKVTVADLRGDYSSWKLTVQAEPLTMYDEDGYPRYSLPEGSLILSNVYRYDNYGYKYYFYSHGGGVIDDGEVTIAKASGYGLFNIYYLDDEALWLTIDPATARVGEYETTLIWTLYPYDDETTFQ